MIFREGMREGVGYRDATGIKDSIFKAYPLFIALKANISIECHVLVILLVASYPSLNTV